MVGTTEPLCVSVCMHLICICVKTVNNSFQFRFVFEVNVN